MFRESVDLENFQNDQLKKLLIKFYTKDRKKDSSDYRKLSLQNLKHGLKRHFRKNVILIYLGQS